MLLFLLFVQTKRKHINWHLRSAICANISAFSVHSLFQFFYLNIILLEMLQATITNKYHLCIAHNTTHPWYLFYHTEERNVTGCIFAEVKMINGPRSICSDKYTLMIESRMFQSKPASTNSKLLILILFMKWALWRCKACLDRFQDCKKGRAKMMFWSTCFLKKKKF